MNSIACRLKMVQIIALFVLTVPFVLQANIKVDKTSTSGKSNFSSHQIGKQDARIDKKIFTTIELQNLNSTHGTNFKGADVVVSYQLSPSFSLGLGTEYSYTGYHFDNGYNLTKLKFLPVFADSKLELTKGRTITPFLHLSTGVSFANYYKEDVNTLGTLHHVSESGIYAYSGFGVSYKLGNSISTFIETGFKGFHMSFNALDINPHGLTFRLGFKF